METETDRRAIGVRLAKLHKDETEHLSQLKGKMDAAEERWKTAEDEFLKARFKFGGECSSVRHEIDVLEAELRETAPPAIGEFIDRAQELHNRRRHSLTGEQLASIRGTIETARALKLEPVLADLPKRLAKLESDLSAVVS